MRRLTLLTLLALFACAASASAASITEWYGPARLPIPEGMVEPSQLSGGELSVTLRQPHHTAVTVQCVAGGEVAVWNGPTEGFGETRSIPFSCTGVSACPAPTITPAGLPWSQRLYGVIHPELFDEWTGVSLDFACGDRQDYGAFTGTLIPTQGDADEQCEGMHDEVDNELRFRPDGPRLAGAEGSSLSVVGFVKQGNKGHGLTAEVFPCASTGVGQ
jgi:hypothetical protein